MYTKEQLRRLLIPLMFEQVLNALMRSVDTIMVTNIGSTAISAVSLVDSLNILIINIFTGGAIICAQHLVEKPTLKIKCPKKQGQSSLETIDYLRHPYFHTDYHTLHFIQKTAINTEF